MFFTSFLEKIGKVFMSYCNVTNECVVYKSGIKGTRIASIMQKRTLKTKEENEQAH